MESIFEEKYHNEAVVRCRTGVESKDLRRGVPRENESDVNLAGR